MMLGSFPLRKTRKGRRRSEKVQRAQIALFLTATSIATVSISEGRRKESLPKIARHKTEEIREITAESLESDALILSTRITVNSAVSAKSIPSVLKVMSCPIIPPSMEKVIQ